MIRLNGLLGGENLSGKTGPSAYRTPYLSCFASFTRKILLKAQFHLPLSAYADSYYVKMLLLSLDLD